MKKLAVITSHPIQYHAPWFRHLARERQIDLKVFYLWDFGVTERIDDGFKQAVRWDVPLLTGYQHEFVENTSSRPGTTLWLTSRLRRRSASRFRNRSCYARTKSSSDCSLCLDHRVGGGLDPGLLGRPLTNFSR